jgi:Leucine-rich repeat (LRR) protein
MLNTTMLRNGLAWYYGNYCKDPTLCPEMAELENSAQENDLGLWLDPEPVNPGDYRYDDSFALCLKRQLGLSGNADLEDYKADIRALSVLDCSGQNIKSIVIDYSVGIGSFAGLKELNLANNQIVDVTILQYFEGLETLDLQQNHLWDIRPLGKLSHLLVLNLAENCIEDFSPVSGGTAEVTEVDQDPAKCGL